MIWQTPEVTGSIGWVDEECHPCERESHLKRYKTNVSLFYTRSLQSLLIYNNGDSVLITWNSSTLRNTDTCACKWSYSFICMFDLIKIINPHK